MEGSSSKMLQIASSKRFQLRNAAKNQQNERFQLQNVANSTENRHSQKSKNNSLNKNTKT
jgi:hypothetical protein